MKIPYTSCFVVAMMFGLLILVSNAQAQASAYKVEIVLFKHLSSQGKSSEYWIKPEHLKAATSPDNFYDNSASLQPDEAISTEQEFIPGNDIKPALARYDMESRSFSPLRDGLNGLASNQYNLANSAALIQQSKHFKLLAHFGWTQPRMSENRALPVIITKSPYNENLPDGEITLHVSRFLHMNVDLAQTECVPVSPDSNAATFKSKSPSSSTTTYTGHTRECIEYTYQFKQHRKMRSKKLHYLDNPIFGMLVYITPI